MRFAHPLLIVFFITSVALPVLAQPGPNEEPSAVALQPPGSGDSELDAALLAIVTADNFDDPTNGILAQETPDPNLVEARYVDGEYQLHKLEPDSTQLATVDLPGVYTSAIIAVDVRLVGDTFGRSVALGCRRQPDTSHYRLTVFPDTGQFLLARWDEGERVVLISQSSPAIRMGNESNRIELRCLASTISVAINGQMLGAVRDATYSEGRIWLGAYGSGVTADARFDNLVVSQPTQVQPPPSPTVVEATATPPPLPTPTPEATAAPSATPTPTTIPAYDGVWMAPAGRNSELRLRLVNDQITEIVFLYSTSGNTCSFEGTVTFVPARPVPLAQRSTFTFTGSTQVVHALHPPGGTFTATVGMTLSGRFESTTTATGVAEVNISALDLPTPCQGGQRVQFTATRTTAPLTPQPAVIFVS